MRLWMETGAENVGPSNLLNSFKLTVLRCLGSYRRAASCLRLQSELRSALRACLIWSTQVHHLAKTRRGNLKKKKTNEEGPVCALERGHWEYKTPDILKTLAAKMTLLQFLLFLKPAFFQGLCIFTLNQTNWTEKAETATPTFFVRQQQKYTGRQVCVCVCLSLSFCHSPLF